MDEPILQTGSENQPISDIIGSVTFSYTDSDKIDRVPVDSDHRVLKIYRSRCADVSGRIRADWYRNRIGLFESKLQKGNLVWKNKRKEKYIVFGITYLFFL